MCRRDAFLLLAVVVFGLGSALLPRRYPGPLGDRRPYVEGRMFFEDAVRYVSRGGSGIANVEACHFNLDAQVVLSGVRLEGQVGVWLRQAGRFREDIRAPGVDSTQAWDGGSGWTRSREGGVHGLETDGPGAEEAELLRQRRAVYADLASFITLRPLNGEGVEFRFEGFKEGSGAYAGEWIKIRRVAPNDRSIVLWLAFERTAGGGVVATYPGIVRIEAGSKAGSPTEDYILKDWDATAVWAQRAYRHPLKIEAYAILEGPDGRPAPERFLWAVVADIAINEPIASDTFRRPSD